MFFIFLNHLTKRRLISRHPCLIFKASKKNNLWVTFIDVDPRKNDVFFKNDWMVSPRHVNFKQGSLLVDPKQNLYDSYQLMISQGLQKAFGDFGHIYQSLGFGQFGQQRDQLPMVRCKNLLIFKTSFRKYVGFHMLGIPIRLDNWGHSIL